MTPQNWHNCTRPKKLLHHTPRFIHKPFLSAMLRQLPENLACETGVRDAIDSLDHGFVIRNPIPVSCQPLQEMLTFINIMQRQSIPEDEDESSVYHYITGRWWLLTGTISDIFNLHKWLEREDQADLLRSLYNPPNMQLSLPQSHITDQVRAVASYALAPDNLRPNGSLDPATTAVLADALEEAGCYNPDVINPLRGFVKRYPGPTWKKSRVPLYPGAHVIEAVVAHPLSRGLLAFWPTPTPDRRPT